MIRLGLWVGTPSAISFLASSYSTFLENIVFFFVLSFVALVLGIVPPMQAKTKR
jgi:hypothetical protein